MSDTASTYSSVSTASTLQAEGPDKNPKLFSAVKPSKASSPGPGTKTDEYHKKQLHYEAIASYLALR